LTTYRKTYGDPDPLEVTTMYKEQAHIRQLAHGLQYYITQNETNFHKALEMIG